MTPEVVVRAEATTVPVPARSFEFYRVLTLASLVVGYMGYYLCRANLAGAKGILGSTGIDRDGYGWAVTIGNAFYALGKFTGGAATDSIGGRRIFFIGLFGSVVATVAFGLSGGLVALIVCWAVNRAFQSVGWGGLMSVLSRWYTPSQYGRASGTLSVSYQFGGVVATLFVGLLLAYGANWRVLFLAPAAILTVLGVVLLFTIKESPTEVGYPEPREQDEAPVDEAPIPLGERLKKLLLSPPFLILCSISFVLTLLRETFSNWLPAYFDQMGGAAYYQGVLKSALFPALGCAGTICAGWLSDRFFRHNRAPILVMFLFASTAVLFALSSPDTLAAWAQRSFGVDKGLLATILVALAGFCVLGPYSMVGGGVFALDYGGRKAAGTAAGLLDGVGYTGSILAGAGVAKMLESANGDFRPVFRLMAFAVLATALLSLVLTTLQRRRHA